MHPIPFFERRLKRQKNNKGKNRTLKKSNPINQSSGYVTHDQYQKDHIFKPPQEFYSFVTRGGQKFPEHTLSPSPSTPADDLISLTQRSEDDETPTNQDRDPPPPLGRKMDSL
ncbi:hypothetical protein CEXT_20981 [Caerostris extrusa]|uniref:Uncharacterized protein n=1 Tax=Caerostris extrusa TaxID=172846 RepID=A0AAV4REN2_CAEEX|nr:hypothetical protein CEXT_20981 [Caerostris extrusa]